MKTKSFKRIASMMLAMAMTTVMVASSAFAAGTSGAYNSDNTDYNRNGTGNSSAQRQANSATSTWTKNGAVSAEAIGESSGVITLGKILTVNQRGKFPNVEDFVYKLTPVSAWKNADQSTANAGSAIAKSAMPKPSGGNEVAPAATGAANHLVANYGTGNDWYSYVTLGNFKDGTQPNTSSVVNSDAASNTDLIEDGYRRTRTTDLKFAFTDAGYYMYKVEEVGSIQNGTTINMADPAGITTTKNVAGVDYDNNTYYVVFYVANKQATEDNGANEYGQGTQAGDTVSGTYVHSITSWTNSQSTDNQPADAQDSQALKGAKDLMETMDNGGNAAQPNTGAVDKNNNGVTGGGAGTNGTDGQSDGVSSVTHQNLGKVGLSAVATPNKLEAYRMWNGQTTHDIVLKKNVTGTLGDKSKKFLFTVTLTGLENNTTYTTNVAAGTTDTSADARNDASYVGDTTTASVVLENATAGTLANEGKAFTSTATGTATFQVRLADDEILVINALPRSASYQITEAASDHIPQYDIVSTNKATSGDMAIIAKNADKTVTASNTALATGVEFVDRYDGTVTVIYQNNRDLATITGLQSNIMILLAAAAILALVAGMFFMRRRSYDED